MRQPLAATRAGLEGKAVVYGIRPEHLEFADDGIEAEVVVVEPTGSETQIVARIGKQDIIAVIRDRRPVKPGDKVKLRPIPSAAHIFDKETGKPGPWIGGLTLDPSVVYEAWCSQRPGGIIVMIEEVHGKPTKAGDTFSAAHVVGFFDSIDEMHALCEKYDGDTVLTADAEDWRLSK